MQLREWLNNNSAIATVAAIVLLVGALGFIVYYRMGSGTPTFADVDVWFYDLNNGKLFIEKSSNVPPIKAPSDAPDSETTSGVIAHVFGCGGCASEATLKVGYVERLVGDARRAKLGEPVSEASVAVGHALGREVSLVRPLEWHDVSTPEGMAVTNSSVDCPPDQPPVRCAPAMVGKAVR